MQTTISGITFTRPNDPAMIFNPMVVGASGAGLERLEVYMSNSGGKSITATYDLPGEGLVDVREYAQAMFDGLLMGADIDYTQEAKQSELAQTINVTLIALDGDAGTLAQLNYSQLCVWGATRAGERYTGDVKELVWFKNYPFTAGVYATMGGTFIVDTDNSYACAGQGTYNVSCDDTANDNFKVQLLYVRQGVQLKMDLANIRTVPADYNEGVYLRWVDHLGFWRYWLFKAGDTTVNAANESGTWYRNDLSSWDERYHWQGLAGRHQSYSRNDVIPVCAPLVDSGTFDMLQDITTSPCVDMYMGKSGAVHKWTAVTIEPGQYTKDVKKPEQDFVMNVILPETNLQSL